jgi:hypothetical protein
LAAAVLPDLSLPADSVFRSFRTDYSSVDGQILWMLLEWASARRQVEVVASIATALEERRAAGGPTDSLLAEIADAHDALAHGDSSEARRRLESLTPYGNVADLVWWLPAALVPERLRLAELLIASGSNARAVDVLDGLPAHRSVSAVLFEPLERELRMRARPTVP